MNKALDWVSRHASSVILVTTGAVFVALAVWVVSDRQAVATALVAFGAGAIVLGAVLPRLEGEFSIGPEGLKAILKAVTRKARDQGLADEQVGAATERAVEMVYGKAAGRAHVWSRAVGHATDAIISPRLLPMRSLMRPSRRWLQKSRLPPRAPSQTPSGLCSNLTLTARLGRVNGTRLLEGPAQGSRHCRGHAGRGHGAGGDRSPGGPGRIAVAARAGRDGRETVWIQDPSRQLYAQML